MILLQVIYIAFIGLGLPDSLFATTWPAIYADMWLPFSLGSFFPFLRDVQWSAVREGDTVRRIDVIQTNVMLAQVELNHDERTEDFTMNAWVRRWRRQLVKSIDLVAGSRGTHAHFPDQFISGFYAEPRLQDATHTEPVVLCGEQLPRALQLLPELHETL